MRDAPESKKTQQKRTKSWDTSLNPQLQDHPRGAGACGGAGGGERWRSTRWRGGRGRRDVEGGLDGVGRLLCVPPAAELYSGKPSKWRGGGVVNCSVEGGAVGCLLEFGHLTVGDAS